MGNGALDLANGLKLQTEIKRLSVKNVVTA